MAHCNKSETYQQIHGKVSRRDDGYFYVIKDRQFFRKRDESYHSKQSPKQQWLTAAFAYGQKQAKTLLSDPTTASEIEAAYQSAMHKANGKKYDSALRWQASILQSQWKLDHPFEQWYEAYLANISQEAERKTASESTSQYMLQQQIKALHAQLAELEKRLEK